LVEDMRAVWWCVLVASLVRVAAGGGPVATPGELAALTPLKGQLIAATVVLQLLLTQPEWR
jgi:hypothetical protein